MPKRLSPELEREVRRLAARGHSLREIGSVVERSKHAVSNVLSRQPRAAAATEWNPSAARLSQREREEIRAALARGQSYTLIARLIGRAVSTVAREVAANGGRLDYQAWRAPRRKPGAPSGRSWPTRRWLPRSRHGWRRGGRRKPSPTGCASSSRTIRGCG